MATEFKLPEVGEGIDSGTVVSLLVAVGDQIEKDQAVLELETDKAVVEVPSSVSGVVTALNVKENDEVHIGQVILSVGEGEEAIGVTIEPEDDSEQGQTETAADESAETEKDQAEAQQKASGGTASGGSQDFKLPELGEGIDSGTVVSVLISEGDMVEKDQAVLELETDKAVIEVPSSVSGTVQSLNVAMNDEVAVGQVVFTVSSSGALSNDSASKPSEAQAAKQAKTEEKASSSGQSATSDKVDEKEKYVPAPPSSEEPSERRLVPAAPSVRRLAREMGVDIRQLQGSGILGRISAQDVRDYADGGAVSPSKGAPAPTPSAPKVELPDFSKWGETERVAMSGIRKATVRAMTQAWSTVPMVTQFDKADITAFEALRRKYQPRAEALGTKLTPTAMLIKVMAGALRKFPDFNASIDIDSNEVVYKHYVNIGVAVDTPNGLLVPVIKNADMKNMLELAQELGSLAERARDRKLSPDDMQGGNFNVSNLGGIGGTGFTPIVNPPDVAILGVSRGSIEPIWNKEKSEFEPKMMMPLSLTYDHRLIDGAAAARFLRWVCTAIEDPFLMALEG